MSIAPLYAALAALLFVWLSLRTIRLRRQLLIGLGEKDNPQMLRAVRAHANFAEYAPLALLMIAMVEMQGAPAALVHALGVCLLVGRGLHAWGISQLQERFVFRVSGMMLTFSTLLVAAAYLLYRPLAS